MTNIGKTYPCKYCNEFICNKKVSFGFICLKCNIDYYFEYNNLENPLTMIEFKNGKTYCCVNYMFNKTIITKHKSISVNYIIEDISPYNCDDYYEKLINLELLK